MFENSILQQYYLSYNIFQEEKVYDVALSLTWEVNNLDIEQLQTLSFL